MSSLDANYIEERFFHDGFFLAEVLDNYKITCQECLSKIKTSISQKTPLDFANAVHKLKGSTQNFVIGGFLKELQQLETDARNDQVIGIETEDVNQLEEKLDELISELNSIKEKWILE